MTKKGDKLEIRKKIGKWQKEWVGWTQLDELVHRETEIETEAERPTR